jgi:hypothetical protein
MLEISTINLLLDIVDAIEVRGAVDATIKPIDGSRAALIGTALTCETGPSDNLANFGALAIAAQRCDRCPERCLSQRRGNRRQSGHDGKEPRSRPYNRWHGAQHTGRDRRGAAVF